MKLGKQRTWRRCSGRIRFSLIHDVHHSSVLRCEIQMPLPLMRSDRDARKTDETRMAALATFRRPALIFSEHSMQMAKWIMDIAKDKKKCRDQDRMQRHLKGHERQNKETANLAA
jgi:hypothetical protein